jgi:hypothetical protein
MKLPSVPAPKQNATIVEKVERQVRLMSDRLVNSTMELRRSVGDRPAFTKKLTDVQVARRHWFAWYVYGNAAQPIASAYFAYHLKANGPYAVLEMDRDLRRIGTDWNLVKEALKFAPLKQLEDFQLMRATGLHNGQIQPTAKDMGWKPPKDYKEKQRQVREVAEKESY